MTLPRVVVLDASAVLAWILRERGWEAIDRLLPCAVVPVAAMTETLYRARTRGHRLSSAELHQDLLSLGLVVEPILDEDTIRAAELLGASRLGASVTDPRTLSLGDGLCLAVAERLGLAITGGDDHWSSCSLNVEYRPFR